MAITWGNIRSLLIFFGPILLPKAISYYRTARAAPRQHGLAIRPLPQPVSRALAAVAVIVLTYIVKTLPYFAPENYFAATQSRLQIPVDVLFNRVAALRGPAGGLTSQDELLRARFVNLESRLLYLQFGPETLAGCLFCKAEEPLSYFYYAVPGIILPHLVNLLVVGVVTSGLWTGQDGARWRTMATISAVSLCLVDIYFVNSYNHQANSLALRLVDLDMFYWRARIYRNVGLALLDALLGWLMFLSSTNRAFARPASPAERVESVNRALLTVKSRLNALGIVKNTAIRDEELRNRGQAYWMHEVRLVREVMEEREVIEGVNDALANRINIQSISRDAEAYAQSVLPPPLEVPTTTVG